MPKKSTNTPRKRTDPERRMCAILFLLGVRYEEQVRIGTYTVDFLVRSHDLVIEADGIYWHDRPKAQMHDAKRDAFLNFHGWRVVRFTCEQLKTTPEGVISTLRGIMTMPLAQRRAEMPRKKGNLKTYSNLLKEKNRGNY